METIDEYQNACKTPSQNLTIDDCLKAFRAHAAQNVRRVFIPVHFDLARLFMIAKRTRKQLVQRRC